MRIGYARISTFDETPALQRDALDAAGCDQIFTDAGVDITATERPERDRALEALKPGDTLIVWKLDRLGRSLSDLVQIVAELAHRGVGFRSLSDPIDTGTEDGRIVLPILYALVEFERALFAERHCVRLRTAKLRGQKFGPKPLLTAAQVKRARYLIDTGENPRTVAAFLHVSQTTLWHALKGAAAATPTSLQSGTGDADENAPVRKQSSQKETRRGGVFGPGADTGRSLKAEPTRAGLEAATRSGRKLGRKLALNSAQVAYARMLIEGGKKPRAVAALLHVGPWTLRRALKKAAQATSAPTAPRLDADDTGETNAVRE